MLEYGVPSLAPDTPDVFAGHPFCRECLSRWQATSSLCPVCRADQRTLGRNASQGPEQSSGAFGTDETDHLEGPSLSTILGLMGQLLVREGAGLPNMYPPSVPQEDSDVHYRWSAQHQDQSTLPPEAVEELQSSVQFVMARINSLDRQPVYWSSQMAELQEALELLDACRRGANSNPAQVVQQVQRYTDTVNAQLDEFLTQTEAREQQRRAAEHRHQSSPHTAPPFASAPPQPGTGAHANNAPTSASGSSSGNEAGAGSWAWKWGWGPAPPGTTNEEPHTPGASSSEAQQASGIGFGAAAAAAAALAAVGTAAKAAYRRATADSSPDSSATGAGTGAAGSSAQRPPPAASSTASHQQPPAGAAGSGAAAGQAAPVQGVYNAVRGIFDQHVSADSSLGRWGDVARHLTDLHGQMNADDPQRQDVGRLLTSAVNAYSAYRRATASSSSA